MYLFFFIKIFFYIIFDLITPKLSYISKDKNKILLKTIKKFIDKGFILSTELTFVNMYFFNKHKLNIKYESKKFWNKFLIANNILTPKIYNKNDILLEKEYIIKPNIGIHGNNIEIKKVWDIEFNKRFLVQELLKDNYVNCARSFRIITIYDGTCLIIYELKNKYKNTSNINSGGICKYLNLNNSFLSKDETIKIKNMKNKLCKLHKYKLNNIFSIGWDIMFNKKKLYVLEGNVRLPGILLTTQNNYNYFEYYNKYIEKAMIFDRK